MGPAVVLGLRFKAGVGSGCVWVFGDLQTLGHAGFGAFCSAPNAAFNGGIFYTFPRLFLYGRKAAPPWSACLDPLLCLGMMLVMHQHLFLISSGIAGLWDRQMPP